MMNTIGKYFMSEILRSIHAEWPCLCRKIANPYLNEALIIQTKNRMASEFRAEFQAK